jgi:hypothetical protein
MLRGAIYLLALVLTLGLTPNHAKGADYLASQTTQHPSNSDPVLTAAHSSESTGGGLDRLLDVGLGKQRLVLDLGVGID